MCEYWCVLSLFCYLENLSNKLTCIQDKIECRTLYYCLLSAFTSAKTSLVKMVQKELDMFCKATGLMINIQESRMMVSKNISQRKASKFANILGFKSTQNIGKYLGFPLLVGRVKKIIFLLSS